MLNYYLIDTICIKIILKYLGLCHMCHFNVPQDYYKSTEVTNPFKHRKVKVPPSDY